MQRSEIGEVGFGMKLRELQDGPVARFVGCFSGKRKVADLSRGNTRFEFLLYAVEQVGGFAATQLRGAEDLMDLQPRLLSSISVHVLFLRATVFDCEFVRALTVSLPTDLTGCCSICRHLYDEQSHREEARDQEPVQ